MHIIQLFSGQDLASGDYYYRIEQPAHGLSAVPGVEVHNVDLLEITSFDTFAQVPFLVIHHMSDPDLLPLVAARRKNGLVTIFEVADNHHASREHYTESSGRRDRSAEVIDTLLRRCSALQMPSKALANRFGQMNRSHAVFPNCVTTTQTPKPRSGRFVVGWGGSARHYADVAYVAPALIEWCRRHDNVLVAIMGSRRILGLFAGDGKLSAEQLWYKPPGSLDSYLDFLSTLDVGIAPLLPNEFNACRSDVKYLEYASRRVVPLCSKFGPYLDLGGDERIVLFETTEQLMTHLEFLYKNPQQRKRIVDNAQTWVQEKRLDKPEQWQQRCTFYKELAENLNLKRVDMSNLRPDLLKAISKEVGISLNKAARATDFEEAYRICLQAIEFEPTNYQSYYFAGWTLAKLGRLQESLEHLSTALSLNPKSIRTAMLYVHISVLNGDTGPAKRVLDLAIEVEPGLKSLHNLRRIVNSVSEEQLREAASKKIED
jgi:tetratricopeptide (TPR) repeat protein